MVWKQKPQEGLEGNNTSFWEDESTVKLLNLIQLLVYLAFSQDLDEAISCPAVKKQTKKTVTATKLFQVLNIREETQKVTRALRRGKSMAGDHND